MYLKKHLPWLVHKPFRTLTDDLFPMTRLYGPLKFSDDIICKRLKIMFTGINVINKFKEKQEWSKFYWDDVEKELSS